MHSTETEIEDKTGIVGLDWHKLFWNEYTYMNGRVRFERKEDIVYLRAKDLTRLVDLGRNKFRHAISQISIQVLLKYIHLSVHQISPKPLQLQS